MLLPRSTRTHRHASDTTRRLSVEQLESRDTPAPFTPGNLAIYRVGDGVGTLVNTGAAVFLDEYTPSGGLVQSIALPTTSSGANKALVASGTASSEGLLTRSTDGRYLVLTGYNATIPAGSSLAVSNSATTPRTVGRVDVAGTINTTTALTDFSSANSPRSAASTDGTVFWLGGAAGGVRYATLGATTSTQISSTVTNIRSVEIFDGQLYSSTSSGSTFRVGTVGIGTPITSGQTITNLPGFPTSGGPNAFYFADLTESVAGLDTLYVTDEGTDTINKFSLVSGSWAASGSVAASSVRGLTGNVNADGSVSLYGTTGATGASGGGTLYSFTDSTGYNGTISGAASSIATLAAGTNKAFRGVAFVPEVISMGPASLPDVIQGTTYSQSITASGAASPTFAVTSGSLPGGMSLNANTGQITSSNVTASPNTYTFEITASSATGLTASKTYSITVNSPTSTTTTVTTSAGTVTYGTPVTFTATITASSGTASPTAGSVDFFDSGVPIAHVTTTTSTGSGFATFTYTTDPTQLQVNGGAAHTITATYNAGPGFSSSSSSGSGNASQTITPFHLTVTGVTADHKIYDRTTDASLNVSSAGLSGVFDGDTVNLDTDGTAGTFASANVDNDITVNVSGLTIDGASAGNYTLTQPTTTANITERPLTVAAIGMHKEYDGTVTATVTLSDDRVSGDSLTATYSAASFADKHVGTGKTVSVIGISISGTDATNYTLTNTTASTTANITVHELTVTSTSFSKTYDGTTDASVAPTITEGSLQNTDTANFTEVFATRNVGTGLTLIPSGIVNDGNDGNNYAITFQSTPTGTIIVRSISITATPNTKPFDGNISAAAIPDITSGSLGIGDTAVFIETYDTPAPGTGKILTPSGSVLDGNGGDNYFVTFVSAATGTILAGGSGVPLGQGGSFDFGTAGTQIGFLPVAPTDTPTSGTYSTSGVGWVNPGAGAFDRTSLTLPISPRLSNLLVDGEWGYAGGGGNNGVFRVAVTANLDVQVTAITGDTYAGRDTMNIYVSTEVTGPFTRLNPTATTLNTAGQTYPYVSYSGIFNPGANTALYVTIEATHGGASGYWTISGLDVRPVSFIAPLTLTRTGGDDAVPGDGSTTDTYTGTGASPFAELTVNPQAGVVTTSDADPALKGIQVVADSSGAFSFSIRRPYGATSSLLTVTDVTGASGTGFVGATGTVSDGPFGYSTGYLLPSPYMQEYLPPPASPPGTVVQRFDFNNGSSPNTNGFVGVQPGLSYSQATGYGWLNPASGYDRGSASGMSSSQVPLYQDGHWGVGSGTFQIAVGIGDARDVRVYVGDPYRPWPNLSVSIEGGSTLPVAYTTAGQYAFVVLSGADTSGDGVLNVSIHSDYVWVAAGLDVATPGHLPGLPQMAGYSRSTPVGIIPPLTQAELQPVVAEAIRRWALVGADPIALSRVSFRIGDLDGVGRLGEATPGRVTIDDDAYGAGWFVDLTPADDAEFRVTSISTELRGSTAQAAMRIDLLTVVMHELGHELNLGDVDGSLLVGDLMSETLTRGVRRLPATHKTTSAYAAPSATTISVNVSANNPPRRVMSMTQVDAHPLHSGPISLDPCSALGTVIHTAKTDLELEVTCIDLDR